MFILSKPLNILSMTVGGYGFMTGTSMAAPMTTGTAALIYSSRPDLSLADVRRVLLGSAGTTESLRGRIVTGGMLDAYAALISVWRDS